MTYNKIVIKGDFIYKKVNRKWNVLLYMYQRIYNRYLKVQIRKEWQKDVYFIIKRDVYTLGFVRSIR